MKRPNITAGDWKTQKAAGQLSVAAPSQQVAVIVPTPASDDANAQAIAAMHQLLEALERILAHVDSCKYPEDFSFILVEDAATKALIAAGYTEV